MSRTNPLISRHSGLALLTRAIDRARFTCDRLALEAETVARYQQVLDAIAPNAPVVADVSNVQQALSALQEKSLVWRAARGVYALEDSSLAQIMADSGILDQVPTAKP